MRVANALLSDFSEFPVDHPVYHYGTGLITWEDIMRWFFYRCYRGVLVHRIMKMHPRQVPKNVCVFRSIHFFFFLRLWSVEKDWPHIGMKMHSVGLVAISPETEMSLRLKRVVLAFPTLITFTQKALYVPQSPPLVYKAATSDLTVRAALFIQSAAQVDEGVDFLNRLTTLTCSCWLPALLQGVCFL